MFRFEEHNGKITLRHTESHSIDTDMIHKWLYDRGYIKETRAEVAFIDFVTPAEIFDLEKKGFDLFVGSTPESEGVRIFTIYTVRADPKEFRLESNSKHKIDFLDMFKLQMMKMDYMVIANDISQSIANRTLSRHGHKEEDKIVFLHYDVAKIGIENGYPVVEVTPYPDYHGSHKGEYSYQRANEFDEQSLISQKTYSLHPDLSDEEATWLYSGIIRKYKQPEQDETPKAIIIKDGKQIGIIDEEGMLLARSEHLKKIAPLFKQLDEVIYNYNNAEELPDVRGAYRLISQFNKIILAAKEMANGEMEFVTWKMDSSGRGVSLGHYFNDYNEAKKDFAERGNLVEAKEQLTELEIMVIKVGLVKIQQLDLLMPYPDEVNINKLIEKIDAMIPELVEEMVGETVDEEDYELELG